MTDTKCQTIFKYSLLYYLIILAIVRGFKPGLDVYWHLKVGEWIITHQQIPDFGIFTYTQLQTPWVAHEWLSDVILFLTYNSFGWQGLLILSTCCLVLSLLVIHVFLAQTTTFRRGAIFLLISLALLLMHVLPRPHIIALPLFSFWVYQLINAANKKKVPSYWNLPIIFVWSNLHGSFFIGLLLVGFFALEEIVNANTRIEKINSAKQWSVFLLLAVFFSILTPHGINSIIIPFTVAGQTYSLSVIGEWQSPNFHHFQMFEVWLLLFLFIALAKGMRLPLMRIVLLLGIIHLSLKHQRYMADLLPIVTPMLLAPAIQSLFATNKDVFDLQMPFNVKLRYQHVYAIFFLLALSFPVFYLKNPLPEKDIYLLDFFKTLNADKHKLGNIFNAYDLGGMLIFNNIPVFIDGRSEMYGDAYLKQYANAMKVIPANSFSELEKNYDFSWVILNKPASLLAWLSLSTDWACFLQNKNITMYYHVHKVEHVNFYAEKLGAMMENNECFNVSGTKN